MTRNNIITGVLLILACVAVAMHFKQDAQIKRELTERLQQDNNDLLIRLEQTRSELQRQASLRDSIGVLSDSLLSVVYGLTVRNKRLEAEIAKIPGRYDHVAVDSLGKIMDDRASKRWKN